MGRGGATLAQALIGKRRESLGLVLAFAWR